MPPIGRRLRPDAGRADAAPRRPDRYSAESPVPATVGGVKPRRRYMQPGSLRAYVDECPRETIMNGPPTLETYSRAVSKPPPVLSDSHRACALSQPAVCRGRKPHSAPSPRGKRRWHAGSVRGQPVLETLDRDDPEARGALAQPPRLPVLGRVEPAPRRLEVVELENASRFGCQSPSRTTSSPPRARKRPPAAAMAR